jgi:hypothetical protein
MISKGVGEEQVDQAFILPFMEDTYKILGEAMRGKYSIEDINFNL